MQEDQIYKVMVLKKWGAMKHDWAKFVGCYNFIVVMNESKSFKEDIIEKIFIYIETMEKIHYT